MLTVANADRGKLLQKTDPQLYKLLEVSYEAWTDSGIDVRGLRDSNRVGVYTGLCGSEVDSHPDLFQGSQ